jgi:hypothetical protein
MYGFPRRPGTRDFRANRRVYNPAFPRRDLLAVWLRADTGCFQDVGGTSPAVVGTAVRMVTDLSGNNRHAKSSGAGMTLITSNGTAVDNATGVLTCDGAAFALQDIFVVMRAPAAMFSWYGAAFGSNGGRAFLFESGQAQFHYNPYPTSAARNGVELTAPFVVSPLDTFFILRVTPSSPTSAYGWLLGACEGYNARVFVKEVVGYQAGLTDSDRSFVTDILRIRHSIAT